MDLSLTSFTHTDVTMQEDFVGYGPSADLVGHVGVSDRLELGGRLALAFLGLELETKAQLFHRRKTLVALAPAIGAERLTPIDVAVARLPVIVTHQARSWLAVNASAFATGAWFRGRGPVYSHLSGPAGSVGGALGFDLLLGHWEVGAVVELARVDAAFDASESFTAGTMLVHVARQTSSAR